MDGLLLLVEALAAGQDEHRFLTHVFGQVISDILNNRHLFFVLFVDLLVGRVEALEQVAVGVVDQLRFELVVEEVLFAHHVVGFVDVGLG